MVRTGLGAGVAMMCFAFHYCTTGLGANMLEWGMPKTLADYRRAIAHAENNAQLELILNRALPALYTDMGLDHSLLRGVSVATHLHRRDNDWELWFNIEAPVAIRALEHLAPDIFQRMSGGKNQASSIVKGSYDQGFAKEMVPFVIEDVFADNNARIAKRLNEATSLPQWWDTFCEELAWGLFQTRGWTDPTPEQWALGRTQATAFKEKYGQKMQSHFLMHGRMSSSDSVRITSEWSSLANSFHSGIDRSFYPMFAHLPWMKLNTSSMHAFHIDKFDLQSLSAGLHNRVRDHVLTYCQVANVNYMPVWQVLQQAALPEEPYVLQPMDFEHKASGAPDPF